MKKLFPFILSAGILISACKKEKCPAPVTPPVQKKMMVYVRNQFTPTEDLMFVSASKNNGDSWTSGIQQTYGNAPAFGASETLTLDVTAGDVYTISAVCGLGDHTWTQNYTITSDYTAIPVN